MKAAVRFLPLRSLVSILVLLTFSSSALPDGAVQRETKGVLTVEFEGVITATSVELISEAIEVADTAGEAVVLLVNTPGGSLDATFKIVDLIERSPVPIISYVYPPGARAWSAGAFILMAAHVAAMAPNTIVGSSQPVSFDPLSGGSTPIEDSKTINALAKFLGERAKAHGRNETAATLFVTENLNLDDEEALGADVIEVRAEDIGKLLERIDGMEVSVRGEPTTLSTAGAPVMEWGPSLRVRFLDLISDPTLAYLLFVVGFYALFFGLSTPGLGAEVVGGLMLILGLIGLGVTGVNVGGIILMASGFGLLMAEVFVPGFGVLGVAGFVCVFLGSFLLFPRSWIVGADWLNLLYTVLIVVPLAIGGFFVFAAYKVLEARRRRPLELGFVGEEAEVETEVAPGKDGFVVLRGELWKARSQKKIGRGERVRITGKDGPLLIVEPLEKGKEIK